jgi:hypothetical protein
VNAVDGDALQIRMVTARRVRTRRHLGAAVGEAKQGFRGQRARLWRTLGRDVGPWAARMREQRTSAVAMSVVGRIV